MTKILLLIKVDTILDFKEENLTITFSDPNQIKSKENGSNLKYIK